MRARSALALWLLIAASGAPAVALAQEIKDTPTRPVDLVAEAAALVGKPIDYDEQQKIADRSPHAKAEDWRFGLEYANEGGLARAGDTEETGPEKLEIRMESPYGELCDPAAKQIEFTIDMDPRLNAKSDYTKPGDHAEAWLSFADRGVFDPRSRKIDLEYNWDAVNLSFMLDIDKLTAHGAFALCQNNKPAGSPGARCARFSLKGFARAFDFVCRAK